jgi:hypothetical protein
MRLLMDQMGAKRRKIDDPDVGEARGRPLMDPCEPGPKPLHIGQIGPNGGRSEIACHQVVTEGFEEGRIGAPYL